MFIIFTGLTLASLSKLNFSKLHLWPLFWKRWLTGAKETTPTQIYIYFHSPHNPSGVQRFIFIKWPLKRSWNRGCTPPSNKNPPSHENLVSASVITYKFKQNWMVSLAIFKVISDFQKINLLVKNTGRSRKTII